MRSVNEENRKSSQENSKSKTPQLFVSFAGSRSESVAEELVAMLRAIFGNAIGIFNSLQIQAGSFSLEEIRKRLSESDFGILCVTEENQFNPWLIFEAGAISRQLSTNVAPYLIGEFELFDSSPLSKFAFQRRKADEKGTRRLVGDISDALCLPFDQTSNKTFDVYWAELSKLLLDLRNPAVDLAPRLLPELHKESWLIEDKLNRAAFRRWLRNQILSRAIESISEVANTKSWMTGVGRYTATVSSYLKKDAPDPNMTVLALCGEKGFSKKVGNDYFQDFYDFAKNQADKNQDKRIRVCRVFVERERENDPTQEQDRVRMEDVIKEHRNHETDGVMALTIPKAYRGIVDAKYPGIGSSLDAEFGFLLFHGIPEATAITHERREDDLVFSVLRDSLSLDPILKLFRTLCETSTEYRTKTDERELQELFDRIALQRVIQ